MDSVKLTAKEFDLACSLLPSEAMWGDHLSPQIVLQVAEASRRAALEEAVRAVLSASLDAIWADGRLMDPREVGSACAAAIRTLSQKAGEQQ